MSSESEYLNPKFEASVCYNENKLSFNCLDCADLWDCTLQRAIETTSVYKNPIEKLEAYMSTFRVPLFRKIKSYYLIKIKPHLEKLKQSAIRAKREIEKAYLSFFKRLSSQLIIIYIDTRYNWHTLFYNFIKRYFYPRFLSFVERFLDSKFTFINLIKTKVRG